MNELLLDRKAPVHSAKTRPQRSAPSPAAAAPAPSAARARHVRPAGAPPIRLIAIDLDGTLLSSRKTITPRTHTALCAAMARGVKIVLATARPPRSTRPYYEALRLDTPTINYNGALIWDERRRRALMHLPLDPAIARKIIDFARKLRPDMLVSVEILDKWYTDHFSDLPEYMTETARKFAPDFVGPLDAFLTVPITKLMLLGKPAWIEEVELAIARKFLRTVAHTRSDAHLLQLMNPATSKARALAQVAQSLGATAQEVMAIGDAPNDVGMLQWAGLAIAPENAWEPARKVAHDLVPSNDHDGVAVALQRYVLIK